MTEPCHPWHPLLGEARLTVRARRRPRRADAVLAEIEALAADEAKAKRLTARDWQRLDRGLSWAAADAKVVR